jgi:hypothetical protein
MSQSRLDIALASIRSGDTGRKTISLLVQADTEVAVPHLLPYLNQAQALVNKENEEIKNAGEALV